MMQTHRMDHLMVHIKSKIFFPVETFHSIQWLGDSFCYCSSMLSRCGVGISYSRCDYTLLQAMLAEDYTVIKGYPGSGKTSTIAAMVRMFRNRGLSVLLTSYTNAAVDNVLLKLKQVRLLPTRQCQ